MTTPPTDPPPAGTDATRKKLDPDGRAYRRAEILLAFSAAPPINPCPTCGWPKLRGYRCMTCEALPCDGRK